LNLRADITILEAGDADSARRFLMLRHTIQRAAPHNSKERRALAPAGGDEVHNAAVLEAIVRSAQDGRRIPIA
jgi:hypothetical protein